MMKFGLFFDAVGAISLMDLEVGKILFRTFDRSLIQQWLSAYEGNYTLTLLN